MVHASTVTFSSSEKLTPPEDPLGPSTPKITVFSFPCPSLTVLGGMGSWQPVLTSTWHIEGADSLHVIIDNFRSVVPSVWKLILFGNNVQLGVLPWPKCGFISEAQRGIVLQQRKISPCQWKSLVSEAFSAAVGLHVQESYGPDFTRRHKVPDREWE